MNLIDQIKEIKKSIKEAHDKGVCPNIEEISNLFPNGMDSIRATESLGQVNIEDNRIVYLHK